MKKALFILVIFCISIAANAQINNPRDIKNVKTDIKKLNNARPILDSKDIKFEATKGSIIDKLINEIKTSVFPYQLKMVSLNSSKVTNVPFSNFHGSRPVGKYGTSDYVKIVNGGTITASINERITGYDGNDKQFTSVTYHITSFNGKPVVIVKRGRKAGKVLKNITIDHRDGFDYLIKGELQEKNVTTYYLITAFFIIS